MPARKGQGRTCESCAYWVPPKKRLRGLCGEWEAREARQPYSSPDFWCYAWADGGLKRGDTAHQEWANLTLRDMGGRVRSEAAARAKLEARLKTLEGAVRALALAAKSEP